MTINQANNHHGIMLDNKITILANDDRKPNSTNHDRCQGFTAQDSWLFGEDAELLDESNVSMIHHHP